MRVLAYCDIGLPVGLYDVSLPWLILDTLTAHRMKAPFIACFICRHLEQTLRSKAIAFSDMKHVLHI